MEEGDQYDVKRTKTRTLLTNKKEMRSSAKATVKLDKIDNKTLTAQSKMMSINEDDQQLNTLNKIGKHIKLT